MARMRSCLVDGLNIDVHGIFARFRDPATSLTYLKIRSRGGLVTIPDTPLGLRPPFESHSPVPNLTTLYLYIEGALGLCMSALFRFLSCSPRLRKICITAYGDVSYDIAPDQVMLLDSLVELAYTCASADKILPCLRLPRLQRLHVAPSSGSGRVQRLVDLLPNGGRLLLAGATKMSHFSDPTLCKVDLSGKEINASLTRVSHRSRHTTTADWFSEGTYILFGQIKDLTVGGPSVTPNVPISVFENIKVLRVILDGVPSTEGSWHSLFHGRGSLSVPTRCLAHFQVTPGPTHKAS